MNRPSWLPFRKNIYVLRIDSILKYIAQSVYKCFVIGTQFIFHIHENKLRFVDFLEGSIYLFMLFYLIKIYFNSTTKFKNNNNKSKLKRIFFNVKF